MHGCLPPTSASGRKARSTPAPRQTTQPIPMPAQTPQWSPGRSPPALCPAASIAASKISACSWSFPPFCSWFPRCILCRSRLFCAAWPLLFCNLKKSRHLFPSISSPLPRLCLYIPPLKPFRPVSMCRYPSFRFIRHQLFLLFPFTFFPGLNLLAALSPPLSYLSFLIV